MGLDDRLIYLLLGCFIGFALGYIARTLQTLSEKVDEVDKTVKKRDEGGFVRNPIVLDFILLFVVGLTAWSAISSQVASNKSNDTSDTVIQVQKDMAKNQACTTQVLFDVVTAANDRTTYSADQADANIKAWQAQKDLLTKSQDPGLNRAQQLRLYQTYVAQVGHYLEIAVKARDNSQNHTYPTVKDLTGCLQKKDQPNKK